MSAIAERIHLIDEIKDLERELERKRDRVRLLDRFGGKVPLIDRTPQQWQDWADDIAAKIGAVSTGGDAAEDVRRMRDRT